MSYETWSYDWWMGNFVLPVVVLSPIAMMIGLCVYIILDYLGRR